MADDTSQPRVGATAYPSSPGGDRVNAIAAVNRMIKELERMRLESRQPGDELDIDIRDTEGDLASMAFDISEALESEVAGSSSPGGDELPPSCCICEAPAKSVSFLMRFYCEVCYAWYQEVTADPDGAPISSMAAHLRAIRRFAYFGVEPQVPRR